MCPATERGRQSSSIARGSWVVLSDLVWSLVSLLIHGSGSPGALYDLFEGLHGHACEVRGKPFLFHEVMEI